MSGKSGQLQAREIRHRRGPGNQAFVAMWFDERMRSAFDSAISPALVETGYEPYRIDFAHHSRRIDDEIISQIRRSRVVVADATGARPSVYYEAGFAEALGIPVIWCCNKTWRAYTIDPKQMAPEMTAPPQCIECGWFDCVAFDTNHLSFVLWEDEAGLKEKLTNRIRGLGLDIAKV
jgi:nucleoside 2-deoxyribosyltransferase